jgi:hypothetical protein
MSYDGKSVETLAQKKFDAKKDEQAKIDSQKKFTKILADMQAEKDAVVMAFHKMCIAKQNKDFEDEKAKIDAKKDEQAKIDSQKKFTKILADKQAKIDAKQAKIDALPPIGKFARKFWIVVGIEIARLSELYNNA